MHGGGILCNFYVCAFICFAGFGAIVGLHRYTYKCARTHNLTFLSCDPCHNYVHRRSRLCVQRPNRLAPFQKCRRAVANECKTDPKTRHDLCPAHKVVHFGIISARTHDKETFNLMLAHSRTMLMYYSIRRQRRRGRGICIRLETMRYVCPNAASIKPQRINCQTTHCWQRR